MSEKSPAVLPRVRVRAVRVKKLRPRAACRRRLLPGRRRAHEQVPRRVPELVRLTRCGQTTEDQHAEPADPHLAWAAEARAIQARYHLVDDEEVDRLSEQVCGLLVLIGETLAGAREQLVVADRLLGEPDQEPVTIDHTAVRNALTTLDRLLAEGRA